MSSSIEHGVRRRELLLGGISIAALALSGCGEDDAADEGPATRRFVGAQGPVDVPQRPRRTVTMYPTDTDIALVLGLPIVAAPGATGSALQPFAAYHAARLKGVKRITASFEPNYEEIAGARPDVIVDSALSPGDKAGYAKLSGIAPVVAYEPKDWRDYLRVAAAAFGRQQRVEGAMERFETRASDVRTQLGDRWKGKTFASAFVVGDEVIIAGADAQVHQILERDLGMRLHRLVARSSDDRITLSAENLSRLDADVLIIPAYPKENSPSATARISGRCNASRSGRGSRRSRPTRSSSSPASSSTRRR